MLFSRAGKLSLILPTTRVEHFARGLAFAAWGEASNPLVSFVLFLDPWPIGLFKGGAGLMYPSFS